MSKLAIVAAALVGLFPATGVAHAEDAANATPKISLSTDSIDFGDTDKASVDVTIENKGDAVLDIRGINVIEEGYFKRNEHDKEQADSKTDVAKVFTVSPTNLSIPAGGTGKVTVTLDKAGKKQKQFFGALQLLTNDPGQPKVEIGANTHFVAPIKLRAGGDWLYRNVLLIMVFAPLLGMFFLIVLPKGKDQLYRYFSLGVCAIPLGLAFYVYNVFDPSIGVSDGGWGVQFAQHATWIKSFNIEFFVGIDGLSVLMILLTAFISFIACVSSFTIKKHVKGYMMMFLLLEAGMMGTFISLDFFLFYVFWELMLLPMYFLIGVWGGPRKEYAAIKFFLYTLAGSVLMLVALIALYYSSGGANIYEGQQSLALIDGTPAAHTFDFMKLTYLHNFAVEKGILGFKFTQMVWVFLFIGFAIKIPMFPFHTWLPDAHVEAPTAISVILAGVLLKMGTYGIFRMNFAILPDATVWASMAMASFGVINILYGAFCAFAQTDLKKMVAYSSVSHMGFCLLGMAAFTTQGMAGSLMQMFNHGTVTAMLFLLVGVIYDRAHTREINAFGGVASKMPVYAAFFGFAFMASLGLPGLSGFIGEALVFLGAFNKFKVLVILSATGVVVTAAYHLWAMQRIMLGSFKERWSEALSIDLTGREKFMLIPLAVVVLVLGFYPMPALDLIDTSLGDLRMILEAVGG